MIPKTVAFIAVFQVFGHVQAQEIGNVQQGLNLAQSQCAECHLIDAGSRSPNANAPTFVRIANTPGMTSTALVAALRTSHKTMPNIIIRDGDVGDLVAYMLSLSGSH